jgi:HTH-type transcriptional regulator/antitoxin HigA
MSTRTPAEVAHPGEFLKEELDSRNWSQQELADILGRPPRLISEIVGGKRAITPDTAYGLSLALDIPAQTWLALESQFQLSKIPQDDQVQRKAKLYARFPVREMLRRGWVEATSDLGLLETRFCDFFDIKRIDGEPQILHAAKKTYQSEPPTMDQLAWLCRVQSIAERRKVGAFSDKKLSTAISQLKDLRPFPEEVRKVPQILADCGVRLVFVEPIAGSRIDGACLWLGNSPVVAMSLRFDRVDNFWFVLRHELEHVIRGDGKTAFVFDSEISDGATGLPKHERIANEAAADFCADQSRVDKFIRDVNGFISEERVVALAEDLNTHPGLVVGQIQRKLQRHDLLRKFQVKIRSALLLSSDADGWGVASTQTSRR